MDTNSTNCSKEVDRSIAEESHGIDFEAEMVEVNRGSGVIVKIFVPTFIKQANQKQLLDPGLLEQ